MKQPTHNKRKSRFSNYENATAREFKLYVYPDGTPMSKEQIEAKLWMAKMKSP